MHVMQEDIKATVLDLVGNTPLVRINRIARQEGAECEIGMCMDGCVDVFSCKMRILEPGRIGEGQDCQEDG